MNFHGVPVLVTGGSGFVGGRIAAALAAAGAEVRALVRQPGSHPGLGAPNITQMAGDFTDAATAQRACAGQRRVFHAAATVGADLQAALKVNAGGTATIAAAARAAGCERFFHVSTLSVYNFQSGRTVFTEDSPRREEGGTYPHTPAASPHYGTAKAEAERALEVEMARGLPATIFRLAAVLGVSPTSAWAVRVPEKVRQGLVGVRNDPTDIMPWTHVDNVTDAILLAAAQTASIGRAYNVADGEAQWSQFIGEMHSWFPGIAPLPVLPPKAPGFSQSFIGPCPADRIRRELGYTTRRTYAEGMAEAARWWRERLAVGPGA